GITFDIHGGGLDLIFPHHENEIAQSRCAHHDAPLAKVWMHNGFLTINNDKMSKSLGNFFTVRDLLAIAPGEALRLALLTAHYRQPLDFSEDALKKAKQTLDGWYGALRNVKDIPIDKSIPAPANFVDAMDDDLNTPLAFSILHDLTSQLNKASDVKSKAEIKSALLAAANLIGFLSQDADDFLQGKQGDTEKKRIADLIGTRIQAKKDRNFALADKIRSDLTNEGIVLEDMPDGGTLWRRAKPD
ncbi:MAG: class I tRNA ligase family protein, partial [Alphaproteobacteria bacterium]|nr:class I tRNA ligase family protein [Alphaproteobacteria bacterium]